MKEKKNPEVIPIVFAINQNYVKLAMVAIKSMISKSSSENDYKIFIFHADLQESNEKELSQLSTTHISIEFVNVAKVIQTYLDQGLFFKLNIWSVEMFFRLLIPDILMQYDKGIYLDCDTVIHADLKELYDFDIIDYLLAAVKIRHDIDKYKGVLGLTDSKESYFNSGVLLLNLKRCREEHFLNQCIEFLEKTPRQHLSSPDQDVLNVLAKDRVLFLPSEWNYMTNWYVEKSFNPYFITTAKTKKIIHYTGKAHNNVYTYFAADFWETGKKLSLPSGDTVYEHYQKQLELQMERTCTIAFSVPESWQNFCKYWENASSDTVLILLGGQGEFYRMLEFFRQKGYQAPTYLCSESLYVKGKNLLGYSVKSLEEVFKKEQKCTLLVSQRLESMAATQYISKHQDIQLFFADWKEILP